MPRSAASRLHLVNSPVWSETETARVVFATMMVLADNTGRVNMNSNALKIYAKTLLFTEALGFLQSKGYVSPIDGGNAWQIVNFKRYLPLRAFKKPTEKRRNYMREYMQKRRGEKPEAPSAKKATPKKAEKAGRDRDAEFAEFWKAYPRHENKKNARQSWEKVDAELSVVLAAIAAQKKGRAWRDGFIPHPTTWINGKRWEDESQLDLPAVPESVRAVQEGRHYGGPSEINTLRVPEDV